MKIRWIWLAAAAVSILLNVLACGPRLGPDAVEPSQEPSVTKSPRPNVLLISIDTLRADRLGTYGHGRSTSPNLDRLAAEGVRYERAMAPTPWTLPSHAAMLTGVDPYLLGLTAQWRWLPEQAPFLAMSLGQRGYRSAAFVDSKPRGFVGGRRGFARGFDLYAHAPHGEPLVPRYDVARTVDAALDWLREDWRQNDLQDGDPHKNPFFLFLHTRSTHAIPTDEPCRDERCSPYFAPEPFGSRFLPPDLPEDVWDNGAGRKGQDYLWWLNERISAGEASQDVLSVERLAELEALYDGTIAYTDHHLGRLFDGLEALGVAQDTLVIVTSDHGEAFLEHRLLMHQEVYDSSLRIPLLLRWPAAPWSDGRAVAAPVTLEDIAPSVLAWVGGGETPAAMTGHVLSLMDTEPSPQRTLFAYYLFPEKFTYGAFSLEQGAHRLVVHNPEVDTLESELWRSNGESWTLESKQGDAVAEWQQELRRYRQRQPLGEVDDPARSSADSVIDTLGYID